MAAPLPPVSRKKITRRIPPLPKRPHFRATDNKTEILLALLRKAAKASQTAEPQLFHSLREVVQRFRIPLSLGAGIYRQLEREGILRPIRGSGTLLEGLNGTRNARVKGISDRYLAFALRNPSGLSNLCYYDGSGIARA